MFTKGKQSIYGDFYLGDVHKLHKALGGGGGQRFVTL
jgi:hypothetical protein